MNLSTVPNGNRWEGWHRIASSLVRIALLTCVLLILIGHTGGHAHGDDSISISNSAFLRGGRTWIPKGFTIQGFNAPQSKVQRQVAGTAKNWARLLEAQKQVFGADTIRMPVSQAAIDPQGSIHDPSYIELVFQTIEDARRRGFAVIVCMNWQRSTGDHSLSSIPDERTLRAWQVVAKRFNADLGVIYELYNEPIGQASQRADDWSAWQSSMQFLIDGIRATGSRNVLIVEGKNSGHILTGAPALKDQLNALAYAVHPYPVRYPKIGYSSMTASDWDRNFGEFCAQRHTCLITEWMTASNTKCHPLSSSPLDTPTIARNFLSYIEKRQIGMAGAWAFDWFGHATEDFVNFVPTSFSDGFTCSFKRTPPQGPGIMLKEMWSRQD